MASSTNPKEYVQRRGRVLRKAEGKKYAEIYDFITLPYPVEDTILIHPHILKQGLTLVQKEMLRLEEFADAAENPVEADKLKLELLHAYGAYDVLGDEEYGQSV